MRRFALRHYAMPRHLLMPLMPRVIIFATMIIGYFIYAIIMPLIYR